MANLWVIMTGLGVLVERDDPQAPGIVLMRRVLPDQEQVGDVSVPPHEPILSRGPDRPESNVAELEVEFLPAGEGAPQLSEDHRAFLLPVGRELIQAFTVKNRLVTGARLDGLTRIILTGGELEAIQIDNNFQLNKVSRDLRIRLVGLFDPISRSSTALPQGGPIANGLLFKRTTPQQDGAFSVRVGEDVLSIPPVSKEDMGNLRRDDGHVDHVVWIVNVATPGSFDPNGDRVDPGSLGLGSLPGNARLGFDRDFGLLYQWLTQSVDVKHVPITLGEPVVDGDGDPPGQCMYGRVKEGGGGP